MISNDVTKNIPTIEVNSLGCGMGKTTQYIIPKIAEFIKNGEKVIVAVPSLALVSQYEAAFDRKCVVITSNQLSADDISTRVLEALSTNHQLLIITHVALSRIVQTGFRRYWNLIIDEAMENLLEETDIQVNHPTWTRDLRLSDLFEYDSESDQLYSELEVMQDNLYDAVIANGLLARITNNNSRHYTLKSSWNSVLSGRGKFSVISELNARRVFRMWKSIYVAAAAFEKTQMSYWLRSAGIHCDIVLPFTPHKVNLTIVTNDVSFSWSSTKATNDPSILQKFHSEVQQRVGDDTVIVLRNSSRNIQYTNEYSISHNPHGLNNKLLQSSNNIILESCINHTPCQYNWIRQFWLSDLPEAEHKLAINFMRHANLFYQVIMRTGLRNPSTCQTPHYAYVIDTQIAQALHYYFSDAKTDTVTYIDQSPVKMFYACDPQTGQIVHSFKGLIEVVRAGYNKGHVSQCINGLRKTHKRLTWRN